MKFDEMLGVLVLFVGRTIERFKWYMSLCLVPEMMGVETMGVPRKDKVTHPLPIVEVSL